MLIMIGYVVALVGGYLFVSLVFKMLKFQLGTLASFSFAVFCGLMMKEIK